MLAISSLANQMQQSRLFRDNSEGARKPTQLMEILSIYIYKCKKNQNLMKLLKILRDIRH